MCGVVAHIGADHEKSIFSIGERADEASAPRISCADIALATAMRSVSGRELIVSITREERITGLFMTEEILSLCIGFVCNAKFGVFMGEYIA